MPSSTSLSTFSTANTAVVDAISGLLTNGNIIITLVVAGAIALLYRWIKHATNKAKHP